MGVLLAAGAGKRMGTLKQLLPWNDSTTIVASAFDGLATHCGGGMIVVVDASSSERVAQALEDRVFQSVASDSDAEMFASIKLGLRCAAESPGMTHVLLHPADNPIVDAAVVCELLTQPNAPVLIPTHQCKGGHPVLIRADVLPLINDWQGTGGLRAFWEAHPELVRRIEFADAPNLLLDLDTPEDLERARRGPDST